MLEPDHLHSFAYLKALQEQYFTTLIILLLLVSTIAIVILITIAICLTDPGC